MDGAHPILLAEDDDNDFALLQRAAKRGGLINPIFRVHTGEEAIHYLVGHGQFADRNVFPYPRIIITDMKMPKMSGLELLKWLQENPAFNVIPTIVWSSSADKTDVRQAYMLGANVYLRKPSNFEDLVKQTCMLNDFWNNCLLPDL